MPLLKQDIRSSARTGKTTMLLALAAGYYARDIPGVIVTRSQEAVREFKKRHASPFDVWGPNDLNLYLRRLGSATPNYRVFLLDDADLMSSGDGHPSALLEHRFNRSDDYVVVLSFITGEQTKPSVLMSRENPDGWKLESLTEKLREEINSKSLNIASDPSVEAQLVTNNNFQIIGLLMQIEALQCESMVIMSQIGPDQGPTGRARLGNKEKQEGAIC